MRDYEKIARKIVTLLIDDIGCPNGIGIDGIDEYSECKDCTGECDIAECWFKYFDNNGDLSQ